jgi:SAM-dependent methyltransferase
VIGPRQPDHVAGFRKTLAELPPETFFRWFNDSRDIDAAFSQGRKDFEELIIEPAAPFLHGYGSALEIGYGGGRLLAAAARRFRQVIGVDVHERPELVAAALADRGISAELHVGDGRSLPVPDDSVDFVYSFIVFQHMEKLEIVRANIFEAARVLRPGGVAVLFFGRHRFFPHHRTGRSWYELDLLLERFGPPYRELDEPVNVTNVQLARPFAEAMCRDAGFVVESNEPAISALKRGGQHRLVLTLQP